ncbi:universal stress protein [Actinoplanes sp. KI2]|uniref:universal stress protein n=1 Tax=Actinoplanes sp. KI2 TaxID=2983315 RepID=UPI0021D6091B|nr:universal stress protein [Actinoplanes sp. KI2]MCU7724897.1 universal stress protein [Actinoplanes sp. KI2]
MSPRAIVVGVAGSGNLIINWAAREARLQRRPLRIAHVLEWDADEAREASGSTYVERVWSASAAITDAAVRQARDAEPEVDVTADTLVGQPAARLLELAREAELMVVGYRGRGGFAGLRLGSVSQQVATQAPGPVVVVRGTPRPDGPVVAGVDRSPAADQVLDAAFTAAAARGAGLVVVRSYAPAMQVWVASIRPAEVATPEQDAAARTLVEEQLAPWRGKFPDVPVEIRLTRDAIAPVLVGAAAEAQLVVVGSHGRGPIRGALLGSTGLHLLRHAECPVLVARAHRET